MRSLLVAATLLAAAPVAARADRGLQLELPGLSLGASSAGLELPELELGSLTASAFSLDGGSGSGARRHRVEPALCLVLGIIPGFGIGHLVAGSDRWVTWLVIDLVIALLFWGPYWYWPGHPGYFPALNLLVLVERIFQGIFAYEAAGGGRVFRMDGRLAAPALPPPVLAALPVGRAAGVSW